MNFGLKSLLFCILATIMQEQDVLLVNATIQVERAYQVEGYQRDGDAMTLILKLKPSEDKGSVGVNSRRVGRQQDEDEDEPNTTPYIPPIIPGLTKIFNGVLTGNLNDIFHGSTSFAHPNVSHQIDTVYNTVVGLPPPVTTVRTTTAAPAVANAANGTATASAAATTDEDDDGEDTESETESKDIFNNANRANTPKRFVNSKGGAAEHRRTPRHLN